MKRDMDLVRKILLASETAANGENDFFFVSDEYNKWFVSEHIRSMQNAGLIEAEALPDTEDPFIQHWRIDRLTWSGHDFVESVRDDETWAKTKEGVLAAKGWTFDLLREFAKGFLKKKLEDTTGVKL
jgi:hypothetical protein